LARKGNTGEKNCDFLRKDRSSVLGSEKGGELYFRERKERKKGVTRKEQGRYFGG